MRTLPPPNQGPSKGIAVVAVAVSMVIVIFAFAGSVRIGLLVAGKSDWLSFRETLGVGVAVFLLRVADRVLWTQPKKDLNDDIWE